MSWYYILINVYGYSVAAWLLWLITRRARDGFTFAHIFSAFWGLCIVSTEIPPVFENRPDIQTILVLFGAWWSFLLGSLWILRKPIPKGGTSYQLNRGRALITLWALFAVHVITWWIEVPDLRDLGQNLTDIVFGMSELRIHLELNAKIPWYLQFVRSGFIYYFPLATLVRYNRWISRFTFTLIVIAGCAMSLVKFTRAPLLWAIMVLLVSWKLVYKPTIKSVGVVALIAGLGFSGLFLGMQTFLVRDWSNTGVHAALDGYWGGSMRAYETILHGEYPRYKGNFYTLDMLNYTLEKLGIISDLSGAGPAVR